MEVPENTGTPEIGQNVRIVDYKPEYQTAFRALNEEWISAYFSMESSDHKALDNPEGYILNKGGCILVALVDEQPAGVCALIKMDDPEYDFELAKMAVSPQFQGRKIGLMLGEAILQKAKSMGAARVYLESNTLLQTAIKLYYKLGFEKIAGRSTPYERCNIQMGRVIV
jgi:GNAT superfamily N-acetyltransferase